MKRHENDKTAQSQKNHKKAIEHFKKLGLLKQGMVLHHKDTDMKSDDFERYIKWNFKDLVPMTKSEHRRLHMKLQNPKKTKKTKSHKANISEGIRSFRTQHKFGTYVWEVTRPVVEKYETKCFNTAKEAAEWLGMSKQFVCQMAKFKREGKNTNGIIVKIVEK